MGINAEYMGSQSSSRTNMKVIAIVLLVAVAVQAENCQVYRSGLEAIFSKVPKPESLLTPDGVCEDGEGWGWIALLKSGWTLLVSRSVSRRRLEQPATATIAFV